jgi:hypothetical protein
MAVETRRKQPPASRAAVPSSGGRHRRPPVTPARRVAAGARSAARHDVRPAVRGGYQAGRKAAVFTTQRKGGQHALMAEFLLFTGIVALRAVADYVPAEQGQPTEGTSKGAITPRSGQLGPLPVLAAGFVVFFVLSFLAARGGTWAKVAAAFGMVVDVALLMKSLPELETVSKSFGNIGQPQAIPSAGTAATLPTPGGTLNPAVFPGAYTQIPDATGIFPVITPNVPPVAPGAGINPAVFTQP